MAQRRPSAGLRCQAFAFPCLVVCYVHFILLGGLVFMAVEMPVEERLRAEVKEQRRSFLQENPCVREDRLDELLGKALNAHRYDVAVLKAEAEERHYDFTSSLYFVIVTLTTMGSDSYTPQSDQAKFFCILYCTLGIPLTLFLLHLLSDVLLPVVTEGPVRHLHTFWGLSHIRAALVHAGLLSLLLFGLLLLLPALLVSAVERDWTFLDAVFFCFVILSTVGQGEYALGRNWDPTAKETLELLITCYLLLGLVLILTYKQTVVRLPQVRALIRLFSGSHYAQLDGVRLSELTLSGESFEEDPQYSSSICTISSAPLEMMESRLEVQGEKPHGCTSPLQ